MSYQDTIIIKEEFHSKHEYFYEIIHLDMQIDANITMEDIEEMIGNENESK